MLEPQLALITLRFATREDCRPVWEWRNDPETRQLSFNSSYIPFKDHERWFLTKIDASDTRIFVALDAHGVEVGYVRFSVLEDEAEISVAVDKTQRGKGYGTAAIKEGSDQLLATGVAKRIVAYVKQDNPASITAFQRAGYVIAGVKVVADTDVHEMVYVGGE